MKNLFVAFCLLISIIASAQYSITGKIEGYMRRDVNICSQFGDESKLIASVKTDLNGAFNFLFEKQEPGLYRAYFDNEAYFDFICNKEDIELSTKIENPAFNMVIIKSDENIQLYSYIVDNFIYDYKLDVLTQFAEIYPEGKFRRSAERELKKQTDKKNSSLNKIINKNTDSFAGRYLVYLKEIPVSSKFNEAQKMEFLRKEYLKNFKFNDVLLINSNAYQLVVLNYFKLFKSNNPDTYYLAGKDVLDYIFFEDPKIVSTVFEYILSGFESLGLDEPAAKLSLEFGDVCGGGDESLNMRIKSNTELTVGKIAPDFNVVATNGKTIKLSNMASDYTLLIFWATWCDHCHVVLPRLAAAMNIFNEAKVNIVAVSIDTDKEALSAYLEKNPLPWDVVCEGSGWDGKIVVDYAIFATPTMCLINKDMKIVAKPYNEERLYNELEKILTE